jgi:hypothetical protein
MTTEIRPIPVPRARQIISIQYYNLAGQRLSDPGKAQIFIRKIIYDDGSVESRKIKTP